MFKRVLFRFIRKHFFYYNIERIWAAKGKVFDIEINELEHSLYIPVWSTYGHYKDLKPIDVLLNKIDKYNREWNRIEKADLSYPICVIKFFGRYIIIDGHHRLCKAKICCNKTIKAKRISLLSILNIPFKEYRYERRKVKVRSA